MPTAASPGPGGAARRGAPAGETLTHVVFRLLHDCPVSRLSRGFPRTRFLTWSGRRTEIGYALGPADEREDLQRALSTDLPHARTFPTEGGLVFLFSPKLSKERSISWQLESHGTLWLQPLRCEAGWEHFDVVSLDPRRLETLLAELLARYPLEILSRKAFSAAELSRSLFLPLNPLVGGLTAKQQEALQATEAMGYYESPRQATTRDVAKRLGISRSAFEERLRNAENAILRGVAKAGSRHPSSRPPASPRGAGRKRREP